ncbi:MAG: hypothetical protein BGO78_12550 [Chloroflexi bacterium 44-23]|nr:MAG: hypothetical protein BGO78_12550 [Chloroflexi bacterium 44-23]
MKRYLLILIVTLFTLSACTPVATPESEGDVKSPVTTTAVPPEITKSSTATMEPTIQPTPTDTPQPQPSWVAFIDLTGNVFLLNVNNAQVQVLTVDGSSPMISVDKSAVRYSDPAWSSDGRYLAVKRTEITQLSDQQQYTFGITVFDVITGTSSNLLPESQLSNFAWQPGTHVIAYSLMTDPAYFISRSAVDETLARGILAIDVDTGQVTELVKPQSYSLVRVQFSPDGRFVSFDEVIYMEGRGNFAYVELESGEYTSWERPLGNYDWSQDGETLVYDDLTYVSSGDERIYINDRFDEGEKVLVEAEDGYYASDPSFSADDDYVLFKVTEALVDDPPIILKTIQLSKNQIEDFFEERGIFDIHWSPDSEDVLVVVGPYEDPAIVLVNVYDGTSIALAKGWWPAWKPVTGR